MDVLVNILKSGHSEHSENCICCLDNWVNETNVNQNRNILHFAEGISCPLNEPHNRLYDFVKLHVWEICGSQVMGQNPVHQSDWWIFYTLISQKLKDNVHILMEAWKLWLNHVIFVRYGQTCLDIPNVLQNNKVPISWERVEFLCVSVV